MQGHNYRLFPWMHLKRNENRRISITREFLMTIKYNTNHEWSLTNIFHNVKNESIKWRYSPKHNSPSPQSELLLQDMNAQIYKIGTNWFMIIQVSITITTTTIITITNYLVVFNLWINNKSQKIHLQGIWYLLECSPRLIWNKQKRNSCWHFIGFDRSNLSKNCNR